MADDTAPNVRLVLLGSSLRTLPYTPATTLGDMLKLAEIDPAGRDLHVNGRPTSLDAVLEPGDFVTVIPRIRGGRGRAMTSSAANASYAPRFLPNRITI